MRVVVTGATGNVGTAVVGALAADPAVASVVGIARRPPRYAVEDVAWRTADVTTDDLDPLIDGADAVVHLAWLIQPQHDREALRKVNVDGTRRTLAAASRAGVDRVVVASSVGAYSPGPKDSAVAECWPTDGIPTSMYSRDKVTVERTLDTFAHAHADVRVIRLRPGLIFQAAAAEEIRRYFAGPLLPSRLARPDRIPVVPDVRGLAVQAVHADDVAEAYRLAVLHADADGAYNVAAEPVLEPRAIAAALGARRVRVPANVLRLLADVTWRARLQPTGPGWLDLALGVPIMSTTRIRDELGWAPRSRGDDALHGLLTAMSRQVGGPTPPLAPSR